jgi:tRNA uridine 5-carbamoylmethylation protein Kti12
MNTQTLIVVRGIPGSGKSTYAKTLKIDLEKQGYKVEHVEADDYWYNDKGEYVFHTSKLYYAHKNCFERVFRAFDEGAQYVIVANTFVTRKDLKPYLREAEARDIKVTIYRMDNEFQNVHNVPADKVAYMKEHFVDQENEIKIKRRI